MSPNTAAVLYHQEQRQNVTPDDGSWRTYFKNTAAATVLRVEGILLTIIVAVKMLMVYKRCKQLEKLLENSKCWINIHGSHNTVIHLPPFLSSSFLFF